MKPQHNFSTSDRIRVCIRKRPRNDKEVKSNDPDIVCITNSCTVTVKEQKMSLDLSRYIHQHVMHFDEVFDDSSSNADVYGRTVKPLVEFILNKGVAVCFSFGQTGAGKTYTMIGDKFTMASATAAATTSSATAAAAAATADNKNVNDENLGLWVSFYEIYCGQLFDLLNDRKKLIVMEKHNKQVCITGLMETYVKDLNALIQAINYGRSNRSRGCSGVNPVSSRSHAVLQFDVRCKDSNRRIGRLTFIDLAGSERASDAMMCSKQTRQEGAEINQSLLALKECIRCLDQEQPYKPYRQSKLTHILRESFTDNCRTVMIANISPTQSACENTMNTLRYADRCVFVCVCVSVLCVVPVCFYLFYLCIMFICYKISS
ncbi:hypothetical protein HELRODRAFT_82112 [Helobdella robusta]|uniref:Kinesin-like protein n=1 Tax=Helobdella robusta TaxID=6412 RepID=T1G4N0_HELRO|nr:hypothetical protein HELRODRAFT_82112 [Helobdella robusta]ESO01340.1 hypothetical protein HELRODRAFT_82112 [Helobdella robusta]